MTPEEFVQKMRKLAKLKKLGESDLAVWLERPRVTVRSWFHGHRPTAGPVLDECVRRLTLLERDRGAFPVPYEVLKRERPSYIKRALLDADHERVSKRNTSVAGKVLPRRH